MSKQAKTDKKKQEQDDSTAKIFPFYRKKCDNNGIQPNQAIKQKIMQAVDSNKNLEKLHYWQQLGPVQVRCLAQGLYDIDYQHLKQLKIWKSRIGDQGVRAICKYMARSNTIKVLDILDNQITALGCQFLGKVLSNPDCKLQKLKIDDNPIKTQGLRNLTFGLAKNPTIHKLSIKYCGIDKKGARYVQQILANIKSKMRSLKLQGNAFENQGIYQILRAVNMGGQNLEKLNIADVKMNLLEYKDPRVKRIYKRKVDLSILQGAKKKKKGKAKTVQILQQKPKLKLQQEKQVKLEQKPSQEVKRQKREQERQNNLDLQDEDDIGELLDHIQEEQRIPLSMMEHPCAVDNSFETLEEKIVHELQKALKTNLLIFKYNINYNPMSDHVGQLVMDLVDYNKKITQIQLPNNVSYDIRDQLDTILRKRNKKKVGKKSPSKKKK